MVLELRPRPTLTVVGSINLDLVARVERIPRAGETVFGLLDRVPGGKGANQAVAAARLGAKVRLVAAVGNDEFAVEALVGLEEAGVELDLQRWDVHTGIALISVDDAGENQIVVARGANALLDDVEAVDGPVLAQLEVDWEAAWRATKRASFFCLNAAPADRGLSPDVLKRADLVVVNRFELEALPGTPRLTALTLGEEGAVLLEGGREVARARPPEITAVDGTAAGDAFTACLVVSLLEERSHEEALRRACAAGAIAASRRGAQPSLPTADEVDEILRT